MNVVPTRQDGSLVPPGHKCDTLSQTLPEQMAGGLTEAAEHLPSKHKALRSNPSSTRKNKNKPRR
jgi:hypothetical protein